jgi:hypothetical protein
MDCIEEAMTHQIEEDSRGQDALLVVTTKRPLRRVAEGKQQTERGRRCLCVGWPGEVKRQASEDGGFRRLTQDARTLQRDAVRISLPIAWFRPTTPAVSGPSV